MFDHLDDPDGFRPTDEFRQAVRRRGGRLRRRDRLAVLGSAVVGCVVLAIGGIAVAADRRLDQVDRVQIDAAGEGPAKGVDQPCNLLLVGTDGQPGVEGERADTILVVRIDPDRSEAVILPLPRDLLVPIAGTDGEGRINQAFAGGPERLVATVEAFGVPVDHYVGVSFDGLRAMVDEVGPVAVDFRTPVRDLGSGLRVDEAGCTALGGDDVLALARSRHLERYEGGAWHLDPSGDRGRIEREVALGRIMLATWNDFGIDDLGEVHRVTSTLLESVTVDAALSNQDLVELAVLVNGIRPDAVTALSLSVENHVLDDGAMVLALAEAPNRQLAIMDGTADVDSSPSEPNAGGGTHPPAFGPC